MPQAYSEELLSLVKELSTHADIHALLKSMEGHKSIKLTAANKSELVDKNLRDALDGLAIPLDRVYNLVRDAEENGRQHIFYYVPATPKVKMTYAQAGEKLWGKGWEAAKNFPCFDLVPNKFAYADLRQWNPQLKPLDWILKIYGHEMVEQQTGGDEHVDERTIRRTFVLEPKRLVIVVRWNSPDLLEIRVPEGDSNKRIDRWLDQAWEMITRVFGSDEFTPWDLCPSLRKLITDQKNHSAVYRFSHSRLEDQDHNTISYSSAHPDRSLSSAAHVGESLRDLVRPGISECTYLRVTWLPQKDEFPKEELVSYLGNRKPHEIVIRRRCTAREIDYVTDQLRGFSKTGA